MIDHKSDHKTSLDTLKKIEMIQNIFSDHSGMKLEVNNKEMLEYPPIRAN